MNIFLFLVRLFLCHCALAQSDPILDAITFLVQDSYPEFVIESDKIITEGIGVRKQGPVKPRSGVLPHQAPGTQHPQVRIKTGLVTGETVPGSHAFYSIPYAKPPLGPLRYMPPEPAEDFKETFNASLPNYRMCYQIKDDCPEPDSCQDTMSEDCLVVNVNVPSRLDLTDPDSPPAERLPVLVWFHGGFFFRGRATTTKYDGRWLSPAIDAVVVTLNYRVGPLGFLSFEEDGNLVVGNQAIKDQQLALKWVQDNIHAFGGDNERVTLFANSAGAQAAVFHLLSSTSKPLYERAITESSPSVFKYQTPLESASSITAHLLDAIGCPNDVSCLRSQDAWTITQARDKVMAEALKNKDLWGGVEPFRPVIDGVEFTDQPLNLFQNGIWNSEKAVLFGTNEGEMAYVSAAFEYIPNLAILGDVFEAINNIVLGEDAQTMIDVYTKGQGLRPDYGAIFADELTDMFFVCPNRAMARFASLTSTHPDKRVYLYNNAYGQQNCTSSFTPVCGNAYHSSEQIFVWKSAEGYETTFTDEDSLVSDIFSTYWGGFANDGNPSSGLTTSLGYFTTFPLYSSLSTEPWQNIRITYPQSELQTHYRETYCDAWDAIGFYFDTFPEVITPAP
ncbi:unnamed protein product [Clavelina lepadiformis]|uniref:Carboxylesterase type B domain-containing protein n=1 Tax=Clavelina lepadiformis TaxID=159417 RepID=A0ABP0GGV5_CLALP